MLIFLLGVGLLVLLLLVCRILLVVVEVHGPSMLPTLEPHDRVIAIRYWPKRWLRKGQIVVLLLHPLSNSQPRELRRAPQKNVPLLPQTHRAIPAQSLPHQVIKRIAGLGGETFSLPHSEPRQYPHVLADQNSNETGQMHWVIPEGQVFVRGDNALASTDSRVWGPIATSQIRAVVLGHPHKGYT